MLWFDHNFFLGETAVSESSDEDLSHKAGWVWKGDRVTGDWVQSETGEWLETE